jgi:DNA-binding protein H-NS
MHSALSLLFGRLFFYAQTAAIYGVHILQQEHLVAKRPAPSLTDLSWLEDLSFEQLTTLIAAAEDQLASKRDEAREQLRQEVLEKVRQLGIDPAELFASEKRRSQVKPKYRDKRNPTQTWSGRGRPPRWLQERINAGEDKDDYLIR